VSVQVSLVSHGAVAGSWVRYPMSFVRCPFCQFISEAFPGLKALFQEAPMAAMSLPSLPAYYSPTGTVCQLCEHIKDLALELVNSVKIFNEATTTSKLAPGWYLQREYNVCRLCLTFVSLSVSTKIAYFCKCQFKPEELQHHRPLS
jgi:hypothetical protein